MDENTHLTGTLTEGRVQYSNEDMDLGDVGMFMWPKVPADADYWLVLDGPYDTGGEVLDFEIASALHENYFSGISQRLTHAEALTRLRNGIRSGHIEEEHLLVECYTKCPPPAAAFDEVIQALHEALDTIELTNVTPIGMWAELDGDETTPRETNLVERLAEAHVRRWTFLQPCGIVYVDIMEWANAPGSLELLLSIPDQ